MHPFSVNYQDRDGKRPGTLINRGFWLHQVPRPLLWCRAFGHKPVVDGTTGFRTDDPGHRWVACDRCGLRPDPQGSLDPAQWDIGDRYTGPFTTTPPPPLTSAEIKHLVKQRRPLPAPPLPGPWPNRPTGALGGQLIIGKTVSLGWSAQLKVGNQGSEHTLAAHLRLHPFGALYLHTEEFGTWLQRRLNPTGYESRVIELAIEHGGIAWKLWAKRDESSRTDPWWMHGTIKLDLRDRLFGRRRYAFDNVGDPTHATVRMPHGDDHTVTLQLQHCTFGRNRRRFHSWDVDWTCRGGIPTKPGGRGSIHGASVEVSAEAVNNGTWPAEAAAAIALRLTTDRARYGWSNTAAAA